MSRAEPRPRSTFTYRHLAHAGPRSE